MLKSFAAIAVVGALVACSGPIGKSQPQSAASAERTPLIAMPTGVTLSARSSTVVWALVDYQYLFRSTDAGRTWRQRPTPDGGPLFDISFIDERNGWALRGGPGATQCSFGGATVWRTTDAGATWQSLVSVFASSLRGGGIGFQQCKDGISFTDVMHGYLSAWDDNSPPNIYRSADGGLTWSPTRLPDPPGFKTYGAGDALRASPIADFGSSLLLEASAMQPDGFHRFALQSTDAGATWRAIGVLSSDDVAFVTAARWIAVAEHLETTDAGRTWHPSTSDYSQAAGVAPRVLFGDPVTGYATVRGQIERTTDGGAHWVSVATPGT